MLNVIGVACADSGNSSGSNTPNRAVSSKGKLSVLLYQILKNRREGPTQSCSRK